MDAGSVEAIACLAAHHLSSDRPEESLRLYRRLLQMGAPGPEPWCDAGLACLRAGQADVALPCLERARALAGDAEAPDVWYNLGQVALAIGDLGWARQCFLLAASLDARHPEAWTNLAVLEARRGNVERVGVRNARAPAWWRWRGLGGGVGGSVGGQ